MNIDLTPIKVKDVFEGYEDRGDDGVVGYSGKLDIRPPYQRNFVYTRPEQYEEVIRTVLKKYPLNIMYWVKTGEDTYEVLDGQQRTLSIMQFLTHKFAIKWKGAEVYEDGLTNDEYEKIMDYELKVYICEGDDSEKLDWFRIVNIAGEKLTDQELLNITYTGPWLSSAKRFFSKRNCVAAQMGSKYVKGDPNRQELLEKALIWIAEAKSTTVKEYMASHKSHNDADELWQYYQDVINWVSKIFPTYYSEMKGLDWGGFYNNYHEKQYNSGVLDAEVKRLMTDDEINNKKGIFRYLLSRDEDPYAGKHLSLRQFDKKDMRAVYQKQEGKCAICGRQFPFDDMHGDHIKPWSKGGLTEINNLQMLCADCNLSKSDKY